MKQTALEKKFLQRINRYPKLVHMENEYADDEYIEEPPDSVEALHLEVVNNQGPPDEGTGGLASPNSEPGVLGRVICGEGTPSFFRAHFRLNPGVHVTPGQWVAMEAGNSPAQNCLLLGRVLDASETNPHEDPLSSNIRHVLPFASSYAKEGHSTVIYRSAEVELLDEVHLDEKGEMREVHNVTTMVRAGAAVLPASLDLTARVLGLPTEPEGGIHMGDFAGAPAGSAAFVLDRAVIQRHILNVGGIGTGKSYTRGVQAEELRAHGVPQINIDVNGEMVQATEELGGTNFVPGEDGFTLPLSSLTSQDVLDAIPSINPTTLIAELVRHAHEELLKESLRTGGHFLVQDLVNKIEEIAPTLEAKAQSWVPAKSRALSLSRLPYLGEPFPWESALEPGAIINIDCRGCTVSDLRIIVAAIARDIQRLARAKRIPFVAFSVDEAHLVAPAQEDTLCLQVLRELARIGRHYRIGLILTTQSPQDLDRSILKRLLTRFLHAIEPDQLDSLKGVFADASKQLVQQLPKLPRGLCIVTGAYETIRHATLVDIRDRKTTHGGATPDIWSDFAERGWTGKKEVGS